MRWVLHLDMDAFYASVEQLTRPTLRERPVLVGGLGPRGVVAAASYQAREYGARSAMSMAQARRLCPAATVLPPRFGLYHVVSERVFEVLRELSAVVEQVSLDEAFVQPPALDGAPVGLVTEVCARLRRDVRSAVGLPCSVGAGSGKQLAKIASELAKPDGHRVVPHGTEAALLAPLPVRWLWGVGPAGEARLRRIGVTTIGELAAMDVRDTVEVLGEAVGASLHRLARGEDDRPVAPRTDVRSVSAESTFDLDVSDLATIDAAVTAMATSAHRRLVAGDHAARTVTVKVRGADFSVVSRSESLPAATADLGTLVGLARRLVRVALPPTAVRLIGVAYTGLGGEAQEALFGLDGATDAAAAAGPSTVDVAGPSTEDGGPRSAVRDAGPPAMGDGEPSRTGDSGPSTVDDGGPSRTRDGRPSTVDGGRPSTVDGGRPLSAGDGRPSSAGDGGPSTVDDGGPSSAGHGGPSSAGDGGPSTVDGAAPAAGWRPGDDVSHPEHGHGWVQGAGHGRVTVRFETRATGPGRAITFAADNPSLIRTDPLASLDG